LLREQHRTTTEPSECCIGSSRDAEPRLQELKVRLTCFGRVLLADLFALGRRRPPFDVHMLYRRRMAVHGAMELLEEGWRSPKLLRNATGIRATSASSAGFHAANNITSILPHPSSDSCLRKRVITCHVDNTILHPNAKGQRRTMQMSERVVP
jgi:hypothetical protein